MTNNVVAIAGRLTPAQAESAVTSASGEWTSRARRRLYYPYFWFQLRYTVRTLLETSSVRMSCLVDTRTGLASTADPFELERVDGDAGEVMEPRLAEDEAAPHRPAVRCLRCAKQAKSTHRPGSEGARTEPGP